MSEEQEKSQEKLSSSAKKAKKPDQLAELQEKVAILEAAILKLATFTGYPALMKDLGLKPYEYKAEELKRRA